MYNRGLAPNHVVALDAATGRVFWMYSPTISAARARVLPGGRVNRGLAISGRTRCSWERSTGT